ncbi:NAD(+)/NADH kinase [uncultured Nitrospira sp.]|uniref:NAD(+)/NADH kinase n=1 Tax=uncultured Nitrospira sp. TaxID=157176 RepID=UPI0031400324
MPTFQTIGIITKPHAPNILEETSQLRDWLVAHDKTVILDSTQGLPTSDNPTRIQIAKEADLLIVLGGDGTMLSGARLVEQRGIPILGVNMGGLGFLTEINFDDLPTALEKVFAGECRLDKRLMLKVQLQRGDRILYTYSALNDVVISKGHLARMIATKICVNHAFMTNLRGDGLIVATPTGSTAYSLSAKGPILDPRLEVLLINPICPHTFSHRPFLAPGDVPITIELTSQEPAMATIDGQVGAEMLTGDLVQVRASDHRTHLIRFPERSYFEVLRTKLKWGDG